MKPGSCRPLVLALVALLLPRPAAGCDACGSHSALQLPGVVTGVRARGFVPGGWTLGVQEQYTRFDVRGDNGLRTADERLELVRSYSTTQFTFSYNVTSRFGLQAGVPFVSRRYDRFERFRRVTDTENGLGDASLLAAYAPVSRAFGNDRDFVTFLGGVKFPTGETGSLRRVSEAAEVDDPAASLQGRGLSLGTGSTDFPLGVVGYTRRGAYYLAASAQYNARTEGTAGYRFADDVAWSLSPGIVVDLGEHGELSAGVAVSGERKSSDKLDGTLLPRTSVDNYYVGPDLFYAAGERLTAQFGVDVPVSTDVGSAAVEPEVRVRASIGWAL